MRRPGDRRLALLVLCLPVVLLNVEGTVVTVALPTLMRDLRADSAELLWIVDGYGLAFACLVLTAGVLADRLGRRRVLLAGIAWFGASSALAAFAPSAELLIAARLSMGAGAALLYPTSLALIVQLFSDPHERARAISLWAAVGTSGIVLGPLVGGALVDRFGWGAPFLIAVPLCAALLAVAPLLLPAGGPRTRRPLDLPGLVSAALGLALLLFGVIAGPESGWGSPQVAGALALGAACCAGFLWWEARCAHPMVDLGLFRVRAYAAASSTIAVVYFALIGWSLLVTQHLQLVLGVDAFTAGLCLVPMALGQLGAAALAPRLMRRLGRNVVVAVGVVLVAVTTLAFAFEPLVASVWLVVVNRLVEGVGIGLVVVPTTDAVMGSVPPERSGVGSAVNDTTRMTGGILGVGVLGSLFAVAYADRLGPLPFVPAPLREEAAGSAGASFAVAAELPAADGARLVDASQAAFLSSLRLTTFASVALLALAAVVAHRLLPRRGEPLTVPDDETNVPTHEIIDPFSGMSETVTATAAATPDAPAPTGRYSQAVVAGDLCFLAGQAPFTADGRLVEGGLEAQVRQCFANLAAVAEAAGTSLDRAVRFGVFVSPRADLAEYNRVYAELVSSDPLPARTTIISDLPGFDVEIDAILLRG